MEKKKTAIIILNYNNSSDTINCIESVERYNTAPVKYIVVDNGSTKTQVIDDIDRFLHDTFKDGYARLSDTQTPIGRLPKASFVVSNTNDGYARGNNKGLRFAYADDEIDKILILNSDILFVEDIIPRLRNDLETLNDAVIVSPVLYKKDLKGIDYTCSRKALTLKQRLILYAMLFKDVCGVITKIKNSNNLLYGRKIPVTGNILEIELPSGSCMLLDKQFFMDIGSFDENTFLYCEEDILFEKIKKLGRKNYLDTSLKCIHLGATTTKSQAPSRFILKCSINSNHYLLTHYSNAGKLYLLAMKFFYFLLLMKLNLKILIKH